MGVLPGIEAVVVGWLSVRVQERMYEWGWSMHPMWWMWGAGGEGS
jgi:hypothetical protein